MILTILAVAMPCSLVILSLARIARTSVRKGTSTDKVWVCVYTAINAFSALWSAKVLSSLQSGGLPDDLLRAASTVGAAMFFIFLGTLFVRGALEAASAGTARLAKLIRFAKRKS